MASTSILTNGVSPPLTRSAPRGTVTPPEDDGRHGPLVPAERPTAPARVVAAAPAGQPRCPGRALPVAPPHRRGAARRPRRPRQPRGDLGVPTRSEEHTSELQSLMR